jgi:hypothetical protein
MFTELMKKNRFDHLTTIADTKTALKHVFHVAADNRRAMLELQNQIEELKVRQLLDLLLIKSSLHKVNHFVNLI